MYRRIVVKMGPVLIAAFLLVLFSWWTDQMVDAQSAPVYRLPWEGGSAHAVTQGYFRTDASGRCVEGCSTHKTVSMRSSWDFNLAEGAKVVAARSGRVDLVEDKRNPNHCGSPYPIKNPPPGYVVSANIANEANYVVIDHGDGTAALYLHLSRVADPIKRKVQAKETVEQGEELGLSGKTGWTHCGPHLHFQVQQVGGWFTQSRPIAFSDTDVVAKHPDGVPTSAGRLNPYTSDNGSPQEATLAALWAKMEASWGKDEESAITALEEIMKVDPSYRETREKLYALLVSKGDRSWGAGECEAGRSALVRAQQVRPERPEAAQLLATPIGIVNRVQFTGGNRAPLVFNEEDFHAEFGDGNPIRVQLYPRSESNTSIDEQVLNFKNTIVRKYLSTGLDVCRYNFEWITIPDSQYTPPTVALPRPTQATISKAQLIAMSPVVTKDWELEYFQKFDAFNIFLKSCPHAAAMSNAEQWLAQRGIRRPYSLNINFIREHNC